MRPAAAPCACWHQCVTTCEEISGRQPKKDGEREREQAREEGGKIEIARARERVRLREGDIQGDGEERNRSERSGRAEAVAS